MATFRLALAIELLSRSEAFFWEHCPDPKGDKSIDSARPDLLACRDGLQSY